MHFKIGCLPGTIPFFNGYDLPAFSPALLVVQTLTSAAGWDEQRKTNIDFDPMQRVKNCQLAPIDTTTKEIFGPYFKTEGSGSQQQNHGSLMPPPAGGGNYPQN